jgi:hypothetical protein
MEGMVVDDYHKIQANLKHPRSLKKHLVLTDWLALFRSQPWLAKQEADENVEEGKREEQRYAVTKMKKALDGLRQVSVTRVDVRASA